MKPASTSKAIDWSEVRRRLEAAGQLLDAGFAPPPEQRRVILAARARALAAEPPPAPGPGFEALEFLLAREHYALETSWVREVYPLRELTPLPGTPDFVMGIIHVRGRIVSVLDIKTFFELPAQGLSDLNKVIVLGDGAMEFGILGDAIVGVRRIPRDDLQAPLPTLTDIRAEYLMGITRQRQVVLDGHKLLSDPAIVVAAEVAG
ncbi:MAG: chemotaxis protein CheW [Sulfuritalea sp.]|nr:chemotaxis protein CheW [Sulfuritalea sp.]